MNYAAGLRLADELGVTEHGHNLNASTLRRLVAALGIPSQPTEATHTNYNTGAPCFCDARFDFQPGPCIDEEPMVTGDDPVNGSSANSLPGDTR